MNEFTQITPAISIKQIAKKVSMALAAAATLCSFTATAQTVSTTATFEDGLPLHLEDGVIHNANIDLGLSFSSIELICFTSYFAGDLADPGELFFYGPFPRDNGSGSFGWRNINSTPIESRKVCITEAHSESQLFLDGEQTFGVRMQDGASTLTGVDVEITGTIEVVATHDVSIQLDEGEGIVGAEGGRVKYDATISNLDMEASYKDFVRWSVITLPTGEEYPIHKARSVQVGAGEERTYSRTYLNIPAWFPAGSYSLTWYVADPENPSDLINSDTLMFEKIEN